MAWGLPIYAQLNLGTEILYCIQTLTYSTVDSHLFKDLVHGFPFLLLTAAGPITGGNETPFYTILGTFCLKMQQMRTKSTFRNLQCLVSVNLERFYLQHLTLIYSWVATGLWNHVHSCLCDEVDLKASGNINSHFDWNVPSVHVHA